MNSTELLPEIKVVQRAPLEYLQPEDGYECSVVKVAQILHLFGDVSAPTLDPILTKVKQDLGFNPQEFLSPGEDMRYLLEKGYEWHDYRGPQCFDPVRFHNEGTPYFREFYADQSKEFDDYWTNLRIGSYRRSTEGLLEVFEMPGYSAEQTSLSGLAAVYRTLKSGYIADVVVASGREDAGHNILVTEFKRGNHYPDGSTDEQILEASYFTYADPDNDFGTVGNIHGMTLTDELSPHEPVAGIRKAIKQMGLKTKDGGVPHS